MGAGDKNRNEILSRLAADLFVRTKGGEELSSKIHRLRDEIKKVIESEDTMFGKFHGLVESFREIIPEEKQRYNAAVKALSATSKLSRQEIVKAVNNQLEELKILEKSLMPALPGWRDGFKVMEAKSRELRDEISKLREKIGRLEIEEKVILDGMAVREKEMALVEKAVRELFTDIGAEITQFKNKVEELTAESAAFQPIPPRDFIKSDISPSAAKGGSERKGEIRESPAPQETRESSAPQDTQWQKKCPMCGGRMDFHIREKMWICFSCAYESKEGEVQGKSEEKSERTSTSQLTPVSDPIFDPSTPVADPLADMFSNESAVPQPIPPRDSMKSDIFPSEVKGGGGQKSEIREPSAPQAAEWQKKCPMCGGRMDFYIDEKIWICFSCAYESKEGEVQGKSEEKSERTSTSQLTPVSDPIFDPSAPVADPLTSLSFNEDPIKGSIPGSSASKKQQLSKKKTCPSCHKKMNWHEDEKTWRCPFCEYERRVF